MNSSMSTIAHFIVILIATTFVVVNAARITHFNVVDVSDGYFYRRIVPNQRLHLYGGLALSANVIGEVSNVTFTQPFQHTAERPPFVLLGQPINSRYHQGTFIVEAFINNDKTSTLKISFNLVYPGYPFRGPSEQELKPDVVENDVRDVKIPVVPQCKRKGLPFISDVELSASGGCNGPAVIRSYFTYRACSPKVRIRKLELYIKSPTFYRTRKEHLKIVSSSLKSSKDDTEYFYGEDDFNHCPIGPTYYELCSQYVGRKYTNCTTSIMQSLPRTAIREPLLKSRPPIELRIAPGDTVKINIVTRNASRRSVTYTTPFGTGEMYFGVNTSFALSIIAQARTGKILEESKASISDTATITLRNVTKSNHDGAIVFFQYWYPSCWWFRAAHSVQYGTKIIVDPNLKRLVKQDVRPPTFKQPTLQPTKIGQPLNITVYARNIGGGRYADGTSTKLTYQWYRLRSYSFGGRQYPVPLVGETGPTLHIPKLEDFYFYFGHSSSELRTYFVDVCNTFGCRRSKGIDIGTLLPNYYLEFGGC